MQKKIWILNHGLVNGGTDTFTIQLAAGLKKRQYNVSVVMAIDPDAAKQAREHIVSELGIPLYRTKDPVGIHGMLLHAYRLYKLLKVHKPDVFHANMDLFNGVNMFVAWLARVPVRVCHSHTSQSQYETNTGKHFTVSLYRKFMKTLCRVFANRYCGCSSLAMQYLFDDRWKSNAHAAIIYNGINLDAFRPVQSLPKERKDCYQIITVGRISIPKNPMFIVEIAEQLSRLRQDFELLWVGDGEMKEEAEKAVHEKKLEPYIRFLGSRSDIPDILHQADVFILPSLFEGLGIVLIEAQAAGLYCIASNRVPTEADCGLCAFLPIKDAGVWAVRISEIFDRGVQQKADEALLRRFDAEYMIDQLEKVYFG